MKSYQYDGLMVDDTLLDKFFYQLLSYRKGTIKEVFAAAIEEFFDENREMIFCYSHDLEVFINCYLREHNNATIADALKYSVSEYFWDCLQDNRYTIIENYVEAMLYEAGIDKQVISRLNLLRFADYQMYDTRIDIIQANVARFAITGITP